jgi:hypothetical protein
VILGDLGLGRRRGGRPVEAPHAHVGQAVVVGVAHAVGGAAVGADDGDDGGRGVVGHQAHQPLVGRHVLSGIALLELGVHVPAGAVEDAAGVGVPVALAGVGLLVRADVGEVAGDARLARDGADDAGDGRVHDPVLLGVPVLGPEVLLLRGGAARAARGVRVGDVARLGLDADGAQVHRVVLDVVGDVLDVHHLVDAPVAADHEVRGRADAQQVVDRALAGAGAERGVKDDLGDLAAGDAVGLRDAAAGVGHGADAAAVAAAAAVDDAARALQALDDVAVLIVDQRLDGGHRRLGRGRVGGGPGDGGDVRVLGLDAELAGDGAQALQGAGGAAAIGEGRGGGQREQRQRRGDGAERLHARRIARRPAPDQGPSAGRLEVFRPSPVLGPRTYAARSPRGPGVMVTRPLYSRHARGIGPWA